MIPEALQERVKAADQTATSDHSSAFARFGEDREGGWALLLTRHRESDSLTESNWAVALEELGGEGENVLVENLRDWAVGWVELLLVKVLGEEGTMTPEAEKAMDILTRLEQYPVLDETDFCRRELEEWDRVVSEEIPYQVESLVDDLDLYPADHRELEERLTKQVWKGLEDAPENTPESAHLHVADALEAIMVGRPLEVGDCVA